MKQIEHWIEPRNIQVAESAGGVLATLDPLENLVRGSAPFWPAPELTQKLYASGLWRGKSAEDDSAVRQRLGHYCDLQSLNSEDAITWSFFGPLIYGPSEWRQEFTTSAFAAFGLPEPRSATIWLWRRIPHPEKPASTGGPEIDFGIQSDACVVFGEAKWNSQLGAGQGVDGNRTQLDLRVAYCGSLGPRALPTIRHWVVLGVGRAGGVLSPPSDCDIEIHNASWTQLTEFMPTVLQPELVQYLAWKETHSSKRPNRRMEPTRAGA
jgi:hypothetical protein